MYCNITVIRATNFKAVCFPSNGKYSISFLSAQVIYLRRFKNLRTLNLTGNPLCHDEQYTLFVVAHLPDLVYLDFKLVSDTTVSISAFPACEIGQQHPTENLLCWYACNILAFRAGSLQKLDLQKHAVFILPPPNSCEPVGQILSNLTERQRCQKHDVFTDFVKISSCVWETGLVNVATERLQCECKPSTDQKISEEISLETRIQGKGGLVVLLLGEQFVSVVD